MAGKNVVELTSSTFEKSTESGVALVDFWAPWCGPCRAMAPVMEAVGDELAGKAVVAKVNCDNEPELARRFGVQSIPALFIMKNGKVVEQFLGTQTPQSLIVAMQEQLG